MTLPNPYMRATGVADAVPIYTAGGLFGVPGVDPVLVNAMVNPTGIDRVLTWVESRETNPMFDALVYVGTSGTTQGSFCGDCGKPNFRECMQSAVFGRICQQTQEMQMDMIGLKLNRGVPELALFGNITDGSGNVLVPMGQPIRDVFALNVFGSAYNLRMDFGRTLWTGNPTNNLAGRQEWSGFDLLINDGKWDVITGLTCEGLDSYLSDYGSAVVGVTGSPSILSYIAGALRSIRYRITGSGLDPETAQMYIVMGPQHWDVISAAAACEYGLVCNVGVTTQQDALQVANIRDRFLADMVIRIDGKDYPVIVDNMITQTPSAYGNTTKFCSDIYIITTVVNGRTITYGNYQNFNSTAGPTIAELRSQFGSAPFAITDGGKFLHVPTFQGGLCFDVRTFLKPRIIMRMPQFSGRIQNVCVVPIGHYVPPTGSGMYDELEGGSSTKPSLYLYAYPPGFGG
jgi:hypothetical protein